jgi:hypothetical protein
VRVSKHSRSPFVSNPVCMLEVASLTNRYSRVLDFLDGGIASSSRIDGLGKGIGEYLRSKVVDVPTSFLQRGCI